MAHYAVLDENNVVVTVFVGSDEGGEIDWEVEYVRLGFGQNIKRTSYNTWGGVHQLGGVPFRMNYATIGGTYDEERDAFIPPQPYPSWTLNETVLLWDPPYDPPDDNEDYYWDEETLSWKYN